MSQRRPIRIFMRVDGQNEIEVGMARAVSDVPALLRKVADHWENVLAEGGSGDSSGGATG